jgi:sigma-54 dependent transcriptional regulator, acetoin dehydrogenase operon transcriptional activator AcoR
VVEQRPGQEAAMVPEDDAMPARAGHSGSGDPGTSVSAPVDERLLASWRRSEDYGVPLESVTPVFSGAPEPRDSLFFECGHEVLTSLHRTLVDEPISLMLTDAEGLVLNRLSGDTSLLRALDAVHLAPGFAFSEREAGTNGLGLALADRVPALVRAEEHYSLSLSGYTCAAVPVLDPTTGRLEGTVNITTWSRDRGDLLLALAQSAASTTAALMLARSRGLVPRAAPRGEVYRVEPARLEPGSGTLHDLSPAWREAVDAAASALAAGRLVAAVGEPGSGRATLLAQALRAARPRDRILSAGLPAPQDVAAWLSLWTPEVGKPNTSVIACDVDELPAWAGDEVGQVLGRVAPPGYAARDVTPPGPGAAAPGVATVAATTATSSGGAVTARHFDGIPPAVRALVGTVVEVPPLRERPADVMPLAAHVARRVRGREIEFTPAAQRALTDHGWPGNVEQLVHAVRQAVTRTDVVDARHLPSEVLSGSHRRLTRIEAFEREEIVRALTRPGATMKDAARDLGMSRSTIYRKIAQYDLHVPRL